jgi:hypothetical protein
MEVRCFDHSCSVFIALPLLLILSTLEISLLLTVYGALLSSEAQICNGDNAQVSIRRKMYGQTCMFDSSQHMLTLYPSLSLSVCVCLFLRFFVKFRTSQQIWIEVRKRFCIESGPLLKNDTSPRHQVKFDLCCLI